MTFRKTLLCTLLLLACSGEPQAPLSGGWEVGGTAAREYRVSVTLDRDGESVSVKNGQFWTHGFGTATNTTSAAPYRGKRLQLSARLTARDLSAWGAMWMRVEAANGKVVAYDNMINRRLRGSATDRPVQITLDVAPDAQKLVYGLMMSGRGILSADQIKLREVGLNVASTDLSKRPVPRAGEACNCSADKK